MSDDSAINIDDTHFPLIYVGYPKPFVDADWKIVCTKLDALLDRGRPFGWINDARTPYFPNARQRSMLAEQHKARAADYRRLVPAVAVVSTSALVRGIVVAVEWIHPAPFPHKTFANIADAEAYLRQALNMPPGNAFAMARGGRA